MPNPNPPVDREFDSPSRDFDPITGKFPFADVINDEELTRPGATLQTNPSGEYFRISWGIGDTFSYGQSLVNGAGGPNPSELYGPLQNQSFGEYFSDLVVEAVQDI